MFTVCVAGYSWLIYNVYTTSQKTNDFEVCLIKRIYKIPCPSCGATRSAVYITNGNFTDAWTTNPLGFIIVATLITLPLWLLYDVILKKNSLFEMYRQAELFFRKPIVAIPSIALVLINWAWNIFKNV